MAENGEGSKKDADEAEAKPEAKAKAASPWPSSRKSDKPAAPAVDPPKVTTTDGPVKAAWGAPFDKLDRAWTKLEARLCAGVLVAEIVTLVFWISIRALSSTGRGGPGQMLRSIITSLALGTVAHLATRKRVTQKIALPNGMQIPVSTLVTTIAFGLGWYLGKLWGEAGVVYFANIFAWLENSSILVFFGGVNEIAKRLTLWLALLGASLATAQGKHINVDVVMRFLGPRARVPVAVLGWVAAAIVSIAASWGFFDYVAVEELRAPTSIACPADAQKRCPAPPGSKVDVVTSAMGRDLFLVGRQLSLDIRTLPKVMTGTPYGKWMTPREWNEWLRGGGWEPRFKGEDVKAFELPEDGSIEFRNPSVTAVPGGSEQIRKILVPLLNLVFAFGLFVIGVRFILRSILAISGWVKVDPNAAHGDEELAHAHDHSPQADAVEDAIRAEQGAGR
jgi:TRAP-type C4-dicarboxylate transport system permease small subunit